MTALDKARAAVEAMVEALRNATSALDDLQGTRAARPYHRQAYIAAKAALADSDACIALVRAMGDTPPVDRSGVGVQETLGYLRGSSAREYAAMHVDWLANLIETLALPIDREAGAVVAWQYRISLPDLTGPWQECTKAWAIEAKAHGCEVRALYTHPGPPAAVREALVRMDADRQRFTPRNDFGPMTVSTADYDTLRTWLNENNGGGR